MDWIGIWNSDRGMTGWQFAGTRVAVRLDTEACRTAFDSLSADRILVAGADTAPPEALPAAIMPEQLLSGSGALVLPGLEQGNPRHRMDAARLAAIGFLSLNLDWDGVICLPGRVTHWLTLSAGEAVFLQSALSLSLAGAVGMAVSDLDTAALSEGQSRPERLASALRSAALSGADGTALGWLIGAELAATRALWLGQQVAILGDGAEAAAYRRALETQGLPVTVASAEQMGEKGMLALGTKFGLTR
ncbi:2-dehydro-3-deoxygalactonokinase [Pseudooceanicola sp. LIPI14-2-Ac024]|uniref:2-dehydro-3-deoxygalactonokinase n=1 Tax=Pseudooceanicola sp. LIPI14-2-Ac024 TaxID=3344875 RepID=UPI0035CFB2BA